MKRRLDKLMDEMKARYGSTATVTVHFLDGSSRQRPFLEAFPICATDPNVIDATMESKTGTSLLRAVIDADGDFSEFGEYGE